MTSYSFNEYGQERVKIYRLDGSINIDAPIRIHNYHLIVLTSGELEVDINFRVFKMKAGSSLHISSGDVIRKISSPANEYSGYQIVFSPEFQTEIRTTRKSPISLQLKKEFPYQEFTESEYEVIHSSVLRQSGSARALGAWGRRFKSCHLDQPTERVSGVLYPLLCGRSANIIEA